MGHMLATQFNQINQVIEFCREFDHIEKIHRYRVIRQTVKGKVYESKEYLVHCDEGVYNAILVYENPNGSVEYYTTRVSVYRKSGSTYFTYTLPGEFEEGKKLVLVLMKSVNKEAK